MSGINGALTSVTDRAKKSKLAIKRMAKRWKAARAKLEPIGGGG